MTDPIETTIADVIAGKRTDGDLVTIRGTATWFQYHVTKQENPWLTFLLISPETAVKVDLFPRPYRDFGDLLCPTADGFRPAEVTIIGRVDKRDCQPTVIANSVERHSSPASRTIEEMRLSSEAAREQVFGR